MFDIKEELVGTTLNIRGEKIPILHTNKMSSYLKKHPEIKIALLSVPDSVAQEMLDKLIESGIKGVVNFAPRILKLPKSAKNVQLVNDCIGASLYKIVYQIYSKHKK